VCTLLSQKQQLLQQHLGLCFSLDGKLLLGIPQLVEGYLPDLTQLPQLLLVLARDVVWDEEQACCRTLAQAIAGFYALEECLQLEGPGGDQKAPGSAAREGTRNAAGGSRGEKEQSVAEAGGPDSGLVEAGRSARVLAVDRQEEAAAASREEQRDEGGEVSAMEDPVSSCEGTGNEPANPAAGIVPAGQAVHRDVKQREYLVRHVVCPLLRCHFKPPMGRAKDGAVVLLTSLERLYRVFERCR
jgi:hypothetical protein